MRLRTFAEDLEAARLERLARLVVATVLETPRAEFKPTGIWLRPQGG